MKGMTSHPDSLEEITNSEYSRPLRHDPEPDDSLYDVEPEPDEEYYDTQEEEEYMQAQAENSEMDAPVLRQEVPTYDDLYDVEPELSSPQQLIRPIFKRAPNELYCESEVRDLPLDRRVIALRSPCGTGKTKALMRLLKSHGLQIEDVMILEVTHRKTVSNKAVKALAKLTGRPCLNYKDMKGPIDINQHPILVAQYEALGRLIGYEKNYKKIIVVLDEFNSICHQMHSNFGNVLKAQQVFYDLTQNSQHVIAMDGYLDQERLDILERYTGCQSYLIHNSFKSRADQVFTITTEQKKSVAYIISSMQKGEHVIVPCMNKSLAGYIHNQVVACFGDSKKILIYTHDNPWCGEDIDTTWAQADLVIHTSTIDCGISFEVNNHFQLCVCFFDNCTGPTHETAAQMLSRSRDTCRFLLCIRSAKYLHRDPTPNGVLADFRMRGQARTLDQAFFGIQGLRYNCSSDWASCNPYLSALVMTEVIRRRSKNEFKSSLLQLLYQDGAKISNKCMVFEGIPIPVMGDTNIQIPENQDILQERVVELSMHYKYKYDDGFKIDPDDKEAIKLYERAAKRSAYSNVSMLARLGVDFLSAVEQMGVIWPRQLPVLRLAGCLVISIKPCNQEGKHWLAFLEVAMILMPI